MTGARLVVTLNDESFRGAVTRLQTLARDATPVMRAIGAGMVRNVENRLGGTKDPQGGDWPALSPAYAAIRKDGVQGMLRVTGELARSITSQAGPASVIVGSNKVYAAVHQFGAKIEARDAPALVFRLGGPDGHPMVVKRKSVTVPARPYLGIGPEDELVIGEAIDGALERAIAGA